MCDPVAQSGGEARRAIENNVTAESFVDLRELNGALKARATAAGDGCAKPGREVHRIWKDGVVAVGVERGAGSDIDGAGAQGIADVQASISRVQSGPNPGLKLLGFLITMRSARRTVHQLFEENLRSLYGEAVFRATVPAAPEFPEAIMKRLPISAYKPKGAPARAIRAVADELLERLALGTIEGQERGRGAA